VATTDRVLPCIFLHSGCPPCRRSSVPVFCLKAPASAGRPCHTACGGEPWSFPHTELPTPTPPTPGPIFCSPCSGTSWHGTSRAGHTYVSPSFTWLTYAHIQVGTMGGSEWSCQPQQQYTPGGSSSNSGGGTAAISDAHLEALSNLAPTLTGGANDISDTKTTGGPEHNGSGMPQVCCQGCTVAHEHACHLGLAALWPAA
jgi:hypothetical protein